jgi:hypothetical protein
LLLAAFICFLLPPSLLLLSFILNDRCINWWAPFITVSLGSYYYYCSSSSLPIRSLEVYI